MASRRPIGIAPRDVGLIAASAALGLAIAWLDARPSWDDTGVTAALLVLAAAVPAALDGRRPWLWAVFVAAPLPIIELPSGGPAALVAFLFAGVGAALGFLARRAVRAGPRTT